MIKNRYIFEITSWFFFKTWSWYWASNLKLCKGGIYWFSNCFRSAYSFKLPFLLTKPFLIPFCSMELTETDFSFHLESFVYLISQILSSSFQKTLSLARFSHFHYTCAGKIYESCWTFPGQIETVLFILRSHSNLARYKIDTCSRESNGRDLTSIITTEIVFLLPCKSILWASFIIFFEIHIFLNT